MIMTPVLMTLQEAADFLGIKPGSIYYYVNNHRLRTETNVQGERCFLREDVERIARDTRGVRRQTTQQPSETTSYVAETAPEANNEKRLFLTISAAVYDAFERQGVQGTIQSIREVTSGLRQWQAKVETDGEERLYRVFFDGDYTHITVYDDQLIRTFQRQIEEAREKLAETEQYLAWYRNQESIRTLDGFAEPLEILVQHTHEGFVVRSSQFPFYALGKNEDDAIANFRGLLQGYTHHLMSARTRMGDAFPPDKQKQLDEASYLLNL